MLWGPALQQHLENRITANYTTEMYISVVLVRSWDSSAGVTRSCRLEAGIRFLAWASYEYFGWDYRSDGIPRILTPR
jgi:hypothetical protein